MNDTCDTFMDYTIQDWILALRDECDEMMRNEKIRMIGITIAPGKMNGGRGIEEDIAGGKKQVKSVEDATNEPISS